VCMCVCAGVFNVSLCVFATDSPAETIWGVCVCVCICIYVCMCVCVMNWRVCIDVL